ncbi:hypothetical protein L1987_13784 [Smallanthus sonchifolius]|uniref:Uncharacterized protein n=1 Tax=Smallanthus sonchifolius TaxID=185202 RepID=A0ACB9JJQ7_9ASTR|nr:hypothetical protein L1987_13784 [Smallanthus sonchifolius]
MAQKPSCPIRFRHVILHNPYKQTLLHPTILKSNPTLSPLSLSIMEGLIPFVYRAIMQQKNAGGQSLLRSTLNDSPSSSYVRLRTGESGRFQASNFHILRSDHVFSTSSSPSSATHRRTATAPSSEFNRSAVM